MPTDKKHLWLAHSVDVPTGEKPEKENQPIPLKRVGPGLLSEVGLSEKEIAKLPRGAVRAATADEIEAGAARAKAAEAKAILDQQQQDASDAETLRQNERKAAEKKIEETKAETLAKIDEAQAKEREKEQQKAADELNKAAKAKAK